MILTSVDVQGKEFDIPLQNVNYVFYLGNEGDNVRGVISLRNPSVRKVDRDGTKVEEFVYEIRLSENGAKMIRKQIIEYQKTWDSELIEEEGK